MAKFITQEDYDASIHPEILDALVRCDWRIVEICEQRAIAQMRCYLSPRYDCDRIFSAQGQARNQIVLMTLLDMVIYHLFSIHNPRNISRIRIDRYERALAWLEGVCRGEISVEGLPAAPAAEVAAPHSGTGSNDL